MKRECQVTGADQYKFFKRPQVPFGQQLQPYVYHAAPRKYFESTIGFDDEKRPTHATVGVQTDYRESEAQTDPYSPEYVVLPGTSPTELLRLATLTWGHGLPAGLAEVEMIQRARAKRAWEATLPPLQDLSQMDKRRRMMEEMEAKEWAFRDAEIQRLQDARLAVLKDLLMKRDEAQKDKTHEKLNQIYSKHQKLSKTKLQKIDSDYNRSLRKLEAKCRNVEEKLERPGILEALKNTPTSRKRRDNELKIPYIDTYEGLLKLEAGLKTQTKRDEPKVSTSRDMIRPPETRAEKLLEKYKALREEHQERERSLRFLIKKKKTDVRPVTPEVETPEVDEDVELTVIHLQKLLRGRTIQHQMMKGKRDHLDLIQELRTVHALQREEQELQKSNKEFVIALKEQRERQRHETAEVEASQARVVGAELEHLFDTLSKELIHLQEERRIHAFTLLAERDRRLREAEESGKRQVEEHRRTEEDEIFRQVVQVYQETVDVYLEDIILESVEHTADEQAREEIHKRAKEVNDIAIALEESRNDLQSEDIVSELVYSFLIPEIEKIRVRRRVHQRQQRHLLAAQRIIHGAAGQPRTIPPAERAANWVVEELMRQVEQVQETAAEQQSAEDVETVNKDNDV
ncbi:uncharacterized protein V6R79_020656 [Siganus canaliculatus]